MQITGIGINAHPDRINGEVERLEDELKDFQEIGYDFVEIPVDAVDVIYCGELDRHRMDDLKAILGRFALKYTVHAPRVLNLRDVKEIELQKKLFKSCIFFSSEIGASIFVYHYGQKTKEKQIEDMLYQSVLEMADFAVNYGVHICVENIEIDTASNVIEFIKRVAKNNVGMTFDFGHAYLASKYFSFDFLGSVEMARPYVKHIHVTDNFGRYEETRLISYEQYKLKRYPDLLLLGRGDLHLPPGWGKVPLDAAFNLLNDYRGIFMLEYDYRRHKSYSREIIETAKQYIK